MRRYAPLIAILLFATFLAARWLSYDVPFVDEWWSIFKSGGDIYGPLSPADIIDRIVTVDPGGMGAGYYLTLGMWESLVGSTPFAVRSYSLLFGALAIAMTYRLGADWFSRRVGVCAAAVMASSAFFLNFMHEARAYTLVAFMTCCVAYFYWRLVSLPAPRFHHYAALTLALAGLAYSHYVALSLAVVIGVYHVLFVRKDRHWWYALGTMLAAALLYVPWLPVIAEVARRGAGDVNRQADSMTAGQAVETLALAFSNGSPALLVLLLAAAVWLIPASRQPPAPSTTPTPQLHPQPSMLWWRVQSRRLSLLARNSPPGAHSSGLIRRPSSLLVLWAVFGLGVALVVNARVPFLVHLRYLIFLWPALALLAALGIEALGRRGVPAALVLGVWMAFGAARGLTLDFNRSLFGEVYRAPAAGIDRALALLDDLVAPHDLVLFHLAQPTFEPFGLFIEDYLVRGLPYPIKHAQTELMNNSFADTDAEYRGDVEAILADHQRVWILDVPEVAESQRTRTLMDRLAETHTDCGVAFERDDAALRLFVARPDIDMLRANPEYEYGNEETGLARMQVLPNAPLDERRIRQDRAVSVVLGWAAANRLRQGTHSVAVHVVDDSGHVVAQDDYPLPQTTYGCHISVLPATLPNGPYRVLVSVYNWQTLAPLPIAGATDGRIQVAEFLITR